MSGAGSGVLPRMRKNALYLYGFLFGSVTFVLFAVLAYTTVRDADRDKAAILDGALAQGYWIARSLEIGHGAPLPQDHTRGMRSLVKEITRHGAVRSLAVLDDSRRVLVASEAALEGTRWLDAPGDPREHGSVLRSDPDTTVVAFPAHFAEVLRRMGDTHAHGDRSVDRAKWVVLSLDTAAAHAHYKDGVMHSVLVSLGIVILGIAAFFFLGMIQRYQLASASIAKLEQIRRDLERFVPRTVQKLIEDNPERPMLDKVERNATVLFLDIERYTRMSEEMPAEALNRLVEKYFSVFLDLILSHGGEINETAGDGIMAIFTAKTPDAHALSAVAAAVAIREQVLALNHANAPHEPEILVNIGINTGQVLLGATTIKGAAGEHLTYTASGMVTNIASRLCDLADHGEICLGNRTAQSLAGRFPVRGPVQTRLKHVRDPEPVYRL